MNEVAGKNEFRNAFPPWKSVVAECGIGHEVKHLFAPCVFLHSSGHILIICRWDDQGGTEGDSTNQQALYFSDDKGVTWRLAGAGPLITKETGSSFPVPSSITHAWLFEDELARTWIYFTVNQPFTWGNNSPERSTGGGEIRKVEISWSGTDWILSGPSSIVWEMGKVLPGPDGNALPNIRVVSWNGILRLRSGNLLMPIGGRETVENPFGTFFPLDRTWVLVSRNDGETWDEAHFMAGGAGQAFAEPTLVETGTDDEIVCLLRVQYDSGNELYRTDSTDGGRSWGKPGPTGLPQCDRQGVKPYLARLGRRHYLLIQTNEQETINRTNIAVFVTDEDGLKRNDWPLLRTLHVGNVRGWWPGSCYGWLASIEEDQVAAAWACHDPKGGRLFFGKFRIKDVLDYPTVEVNGVFDDAGDHRPVYHQDSETMETFWRFHNTRGRLVSPGFGWFSPQNDRRVSVSLHLIDLPAKSRFRIMQFSARNGRDPVLGVFADRKAFRIASAQGEVAVPIRTPCGTLVDIQIHFTGSDALITMDDGEFSKAINLGIEGEPLYASFGGSVESHSCEVILSEVRISGNPRAGLL